MASIFSKIHHDKDRFIRQTLALLQSTPDEKNYQADIAKLQEEINHISAKKDKLMEMSIDGVISNQEFKTRNDRFNEEIKQLENKMQMLAPEQGKNNALTEDLKAIKKALSQELNFENGINAELVSSILEKIVVHNTGDRNKIKLEIHLKAGGIMPLFFDRKNLSFCDTCSLTPPLKTEIFQNQEFEVRRTRDKPVLYAFQVLFCGLIFGVNT